MNPDFHMYDTTILTHVQESEGFYLDSGRGGYRGMEGQFLTLFPGKYYLEKSSYNTLVFIFLMVDAFIRKSKDITETFL